MSAPPPKPPKPGNVTVVKALYPYEAQYDSDISFDEGELIYIIDQTDENWWRGKVGNRTGLIPKNYVAKNMEKVDNPIHDAAKRGNIEFLNECLANKVSVNGLDKAGSTALHWAAHGGHISCMEALLAVPTIQINVQNKLGDTPLHSAAWKGHSGAIQLLLDHGARLDIKNGENKTPLDLAKKAEAAALLKLAVRPVVDAGDDYGDEEDSD